jgi:putative hydrolase
MFSSQGPVNWQVARQIALFLATEGHSEPNPDPVERIAAEQLLRVAELHVGEATGLSTSLTGRPLSLQPVTRGDWAMRSLDAYRPLLERLAASLAATPTAEQDSPPDPAGQLLGELGKMLGPVLLGMQAGSMLGHLARRALGQYDLPLPRQSSDELLLVPANVDGFAQEWSLPSDELRMWVCLHEVSYHAVLGRPHVRARLERLISEYAGGFRVDPQALESRLGELDPNDPAALQALLGNPEVLLGAMRTPEQDQVRTRLESLMTAVVGYVDHTMDTVGRRLITSYTMLTEALRRRRVEASDSDLFVERLLGLELSRAQYERGGAFVKGVVERAGDEGLRRLWMSERELPTAAELDAPGLWLARIDLPD